MIQKDYSNKHSFEFFEQRLSSNSLTVFFLTIDLQQIVEILVMKSNHSYFTSKIARLCITNRDSRYSQDILSFTSDLLLIYFN